MPYITDSINTISDGNVSSLESTLPSLTEEGDLLIWFVILDVAAGTLGVPAGWDDITPNGPEKLQGITSAVYKKIAEAGESNPTVTTTIADGFSTNITSIKAFNTGSPIHGIQKNDAGSSTVITTPGITTSGDNTLILHMFSTHRNKTAWDPSGQAIKYFWNTQNDADAGMGASYYVQKESGVVAGYSWKAEDNLTTQNFTVAINDDPDTYSLPGVPKKHKNYLEGDFFDTTLQDTTGIITGVSGVPNSPNVLEGSFNYSPLEDMPTRRIGENTSGTVFHGKLKRLDAPIDLSSGIVFWNQYQTLSDDRYGELGFCMGLHSGDNDWKLWSMYNSDYPNSEQEWRGLFLSPRSPHILDQKGSLNDSLIDGFSFMTHKDATTPTHHSWVAIWSLYYYYPDTAQFIYGSQTKPLDFSIVNDYFDEDYFPEGAEKQGQDQLLLKIPFYIGDGETQTYFDSTSQCVEFPQLYKKIVQRTHWNVPENEVGFTVCASPLDTINIKSCIVNGDKWKFEIHEESSASASYNFNGFQCINADTVILKPVTTFGGLTFVSCGVVDGSGCDFSNCSFEEQTKDHALQISSGSSLTSCSFSNSNNTGFGVKLLTSGTYTFSNLDFTGFFKDLDVIPTTGTLDITISAGDTPTYQSSGATVNFLLPENVFTVTGLQNNSEVRIYSEGTADELAGVENSTSFFSYNYTGSDMVDIVIHHIDYIPIRLTGLVLQNNSSSLPVQQIFDRNYSNL